MVVVGVCRLTPCLRPESNRHSIPFKEMASTCWATEAEQDGDHRRGERPVELVTGSPRQVGLVGGQQFVERRAAVAR